MCQYPETLEHSVLNGMSPRNPSSQSSESFLEEVSKMLPEPVGLEEIKETRPPGYGRADANMKLWQQAQGLLRSKSDCVPALRWGVDIDFHP